MKYQREELSVTLLEETLPLVVKHYEEISHFKDIKLEPDFDGYLGIEKAGALRFFTIREDDDTLIGYAVFLVRHNMHYKSSLQAFQDVLFLRSEKRGTGMKFINWCDMQLKNEGVQIVYHHVKKRHNFGPMLERLKYELVDLLYARRLDG